jgi:hypothetical protein
VDESADRIPGDRNCFSRENFGRIRRYFQVRLKIFCDHKQIFQKH